MRLIFIIFVLSIYLIFIIGIYYILKNKFRKIKNTLNKVKNKVGVKYS